MGLQPFVLPQGCRVGRGERGVEHRAIEDEKSAPVKAVVPPTRRAASWQVPRNRWTGTSGGSGSLPWRKPVTPFPA
ncbi:hypothetical protein Ait01nite_000720 [Actinoplanes italicus]|nr:hypothetical protein Ait01nite_000720 [Actinoplanes italicus]